MPYIIWGEQYHVHVPLIDEQHEELVKISNVFYDAVKTKRDQNTIFETLNALIRYAEKHFREEEEVFKELGVPEEIIAEHHDIHDMLVEQVFQLQMEMKGSEEKTIHDLKEFLWEWAVGHILHKDKELIKTHLAGEQESPAEPDEDDPPTDAPTDEQEAPAEPDEDDPSTDESTEETDQNSDEIKPD